MYARLVEPIKDAAVRAAWSQWSAIGFALPRVGAKPGHAVVDPEALVLAALALEQHERRFKDVLWIWLDRWSRLLSVSRMANLIGDYPDWMKDRARQFAADAVASGDPRWRRLAGKAKRGSRSPAGRGLSATQPLRDRTTLWLRLRLAFGVGIKADGLTHLITRFQRATVREMAADLGYAERAVRRAVEDLVAARLVLMEATSPVSFRVEPKAWYELLGIEKDAEPLWRSWRELYAIAIGLLDWARAADESRWTPYVAASRLRDAFEALSPLLVRAYVRERPDWQAPPERWLEEFERWVAEFADRMRGTT